MAVDNPAATQGDAPAPQGPLARWCAAHPAACTSLAAGTLIVGTALLSVAARSLEAVPLMGGLALATVGLLLVDRRIRAVCESHPWLTAGVGGVALAGSIVVLLIAYDRASPVLGVVGVVLGLSGFVPLGRTLVVLGRRWERGFVIAGSVAIGLGAAAFAVGWFRVVAVCAILVGLILLRAGIGQLCADSAPALATSWILGRGMTGLGAALLIIGAHEALPSMTLIGGLLLVAGLILLTASWHIHQVRPLGVRGALMLGAAAAVTGYVFLPRDAAEWIPVVVAVLVAAIGISFSWRGEGLLLGAALGFFLVWVLVDRGDVAPLDPYPQAPDRILAVGDSYMSGEGSTTFFPRTNVVGGEENQCRRSSTAYAYLVASRLEYGLDFFACSGAVADEIWTRGQMRPPSPDDVAGELPQLDNPFDPEHIRAVLVSIGGNDAGFGDIGIACVLPGSCAQLRETWLANLSHIGQGITDAFKELKYRFGDEVPIIAIPYPLLLTEEGCSWSALNRAEHAFLYEFITVLDDRVRKSAAEAGIRYLRRGLFAFQDTQICDGEGPEDSSMNFFNLHPTEGSFLDRINPTNWVHGTFHPKPSGHLAIADVLEPRLRLLLAAIENGDAPVNPEPRDAAFEIRRIQLLETILVDPHSLPDDDTMCPFRRVSPFATSLPLVDARQTFRIHAARGAPICHTRPDGTWTDDETGVLTRDGSTVTVQPQIPEEGWRQSFVYRDPEGGWQLQIVELCNRDPQCPHDVNAWMVTQLATAAKQMVVPLVLILLGSWLFALGLRVRYVPIRAPAATSPPNG